VGWNKQEENLGWALWYKPVIPAAERGSQLRTAPRPKNQKKSMKQETLSEK
jgi:hypothetical protein